MQAKSVVSTSLISLVGGSGGYTYYKYKNTPEILNDINRHEREYGGCEFWYANRKNTDTGWYKNDALKANYLRNAINKNENKVDKLKVLVDQLQKGDSFPENQRIREVCQKRKGTIVELTWDQDKWKFYEGWGMAPHKFVSHSQ